MENNQDNKTSGNNSSASSSGDLRNISIGWGIVIGSIVIAISFITVQSIENKSFEQQDIRNEVYKESLSGPYDDCLVTARNKYEVDVSMVRSIINDELRQCNEGIRCVRSTDQIMADLRRSIDTVEMELASEEERCVSLYK